MAGDTDCQCAAVVERLPALHLKGTATLIASEYEMKALIEP